MNLAHITSQNSVLGTLLSGIYAVFAYFVVIHLFSTKRHLRWIGIENKLLEFAFLLYFLGFSKHEIGYYLTVESNYCEQTALCKKMLNKTHPTIVDKLKNIFGFVENLWLEAAGEGILFVVVGLPLFLFAHEISYSAAPMIHVRMSSQLLAVFLTGVFAHLVAKYSGMHDYFCRSSCSPDPLADLSSQPQ